MRTVRSLYSSLTSASTLVNAISLSALAVAGTVALGDQPAHGAPALAAAAAAPGTLVYVKDFNVWVARTDGSGARRITADGTAAHQYHSPSQADTGAIVVAKDERIVRMDAFGHVLGTLDPPALVNSAGHAMDGTPSSVAFSPNGALVAYTMVDQGCPPGVPCGSRFATAYTAADHLTSPATYGTTFGNDPSWLGNDRTVQGGGAIPDVRVHVLGQPTPPRWFVDSQIESPGEELTDPTVSRDREWVAAVRGWGTDTNLVWAKAAGDLVGAPRLWCSTNVEPIAEPAFTADSSTLAWVASGDIWMESDLEDCGPPSRVVRGASEPSFSAAPFGTVDPYVAPQPAPDPNAAPAAPALSAAPAITGKARPGRRLTAVPGTWTGATSYSYRWLRNGKAIRGADAASYRLTRKDARKRLSVRVTATGPGGTATATSAAVLVGR